jgi:hypothetical protein
LETRFASFLACDPEGRRFTGTKRQALARKNLDQAVSQSKSYGGRRIKKQDFAACIRNMDFNASLEIRKLYPVVEDPDASTNGLIRVIDESGEDY